MSYARAHETVSAIIAGVAPTEDRVVGANAVFFEQRGPRLGDRRSREFTLEASVDGDSFPEGPYVAALRGQPRMATSMTCRVHYRAAPGKSGDLNVTIEEDAREIVTELIRPENWQARETTSICFIDDVKHRRTINEDGSIDLGITFMMHYLGGPDRNRIYFGASATDPSTELQITGSFDSRRVRQRQMRIQLVVGTSGSKRGIWIAPASLGTPTFDINGFIGGWTQVATALTVNGDLIQLWHTSSTDIGTVDLRVRW